jgi:glucose-6-phosphate dehydrogenase assembly protein OpcA
MSSGTIPTNDPAAILAELAHSKPHLTTLNLIVWFDDESMRGWICECATKISEKHPSRTIILHAAPGCTGAIVHTGEADSAETSVRIEIGIADMTTEAAVELTAALLDTDVPTVLWWSGEHLNEQTPFRHFVELAGSVVVNSSLVARDATSISELTEFHAENSSVALRDLAWMRLRPWQDIVAFFFDDEQLRQELFSIEHLQIVSGSDTEALYVGGWLASRLGWRATARNEFTDRNARRIAFDHVREGPPRRVHSVTLRTNTSVYASEVSAEDADVVRVWVEGKHARPARLFVLQSMDNASLIERAVLEGGTDEIFETALRMVGSLLGEHSPW